MLLRSAQGRGALVPDGDAMSQTFGVIGAGIMGSGIAQALAMHGFRVTLLDVSQPALDCALANIATSLLRLIKKGALLA